MQPAAMPTAMEMTIWKNFITMPRTARGIWAYSALPKTGSMAPYWVQTFCTTAMEMTREIWARKLVMPRGRNFFISLPQRPKLLLSSWAAFMRRRYQMERAAVKICPRTVATAAPIMPQRNAKMKIGSRIRLATAPARVAPMANFGLPSERMMGFMAWPNM